jgi:hypothetical protein
VWRSQVALFKIAKCAWPCTDFADHERQLGGCIKIRQLGPTGPLPGARPPAGESEPHA